MNSSANNTAKPWRGYSFDELQAQRAAAYARREVYRAMMSERIHSVARSPQTLVGNAMSSMGMGMAKSVLGNLRLINYLFMGYKVAKKVFSIFKRLRK